MGAASPPVEHRPPPMDASGGHQEGESKDAALPHPQSCSRPTLRTRVHEATAHGLPWLVSCGEGEPPSEAAMPPPALPMPQANPTHSGFLLGVLWDFWGFWGASEGLLTPLQIPMLHCCQSNPALTWEQAAGNKLSRATLDLLPMALCLAITGVITWI